MLSTGTPLAGRNQPAEKAQTQHIDLNQNILEQPSSGIIVASSCWKEACTISQLFAAIFIRTTQRSQKDVGFVLECWRFGHPLKVKSGLTLDAAAALPDTVTFPSDTNLMSAAFSFKSLSQTGTQESE